MKNTNFSVLMSFYRNDKPELLRKALDSIFQNSIVPSEIILIQDGPVGAELTAVISSYSSKDILKITVLKENVGLARALNIGLGLISNPYTFRADADDYNMPNRFIKQLKFLEDGVALVGSSILEVDAHGKNIAIRTAPPNEIEIKKLIGRRNPFNHMSVAFRTDVVIAVGGYPNIYLKEDYALWAKIVARGYKVANLDDILVRATAGRDMYRRRGGILYVQSEIEMQRFLMQQNLQNFQWALIYGVSRSLVFLLPSKIRGYIYENFLRKPASKS